MTHKLTDKASVLEVPADNQTYTRAGEIYSTVEDVTQWNTDVNGSYIQDGKLALSVSESTEIANADTLYPDLWANSPAAWKNSTTLTIPAQGHQSTPWVDVTAVMQSSGQPVGANGVTGTYAFYFARMLGNTLDIKFRWNGSGVGQNTNDIIFPYPPASTFGLDSLTTFQSAVVDNVGTITTFGVTHTQPTGIQYVLSNAKAVTTAGVALAKMGTGSNLKGQDITQASSLFHGSASVPMTEVVGQNTPLISVYSNSWPDYIGTGNGGVLGDIKQSILTIEQFNANTANGGEWSLCDGREIPRARYARLYSLIGDTYGAGDGSTTFNLPNFAGRYARGAKADQSDVGDMLDDATSAANLTIAAFDGEKAGAGTTNSTGARTINASSNSSDLYFGYTRSNSSGNVVNGLKADGAYQTYGSTGNIPIKGNITTNVNNVPNHSHNVAVDTNINHGHNISGDTETRPSSITLNTFIRIA